jgi:hypothetical protein
MKGMKGLGAALLTALALTVAVLPASSAFAAAKTLTLTSSEAPVANGSPGDTGLLIAECVLFAEGTVSGNGTSKVKLTGSKAASAECPEGESISGTVTEAQLSSKGTISLKAAIDLTLAGPCIYAFKSIKSTFSVPGSVNFEGTAVGKLSKKGSAPTCTKTTSQFYAGDAAPEPFGEPFQDH